VSSDQADRTARARIRDAAIDLFAERGIAAATIRDIAERAGVSSGLLRHHFGSKEGLRDACDEYAMARMNELREQMLAGGAKADQAIFGSVHPVAMRMQAYLVRSMVDGTTPALFDAMVSAGETWLAGTDIETGDPRAFSAVLVAMQMGLYLMRDQLSRVLDVDATAPAGLARLLVPAVEIFAQPLITPEQADQALKALAWLTNSTGEEKP
jgi:AcrR family transcriptional regulator